MNLGLTFVDFLVILILLVSIVFAMWRGFISETLSIIAWALAAFSALYFGPYAVEILRHVFASWWLAWIVGYAAMFLIVLIPISYASFRASESVKESAVGPVDRAGGALFGAARGLVLVGALYLLFLHLVPYHQQPTSVREARLFPLIRSSAALLNALVPRPDRLRLDTREGSGRGDESSPAAPEAGTQPTRQPNQKLYGAAERRALDRLVETSDHKKP